jgi:hypothetical protein
VQCTGADYKATEEIHRGYAKLGMVVCSKKTNGRATFMTSLHARQCEMFDRAPDDIIEKRIEWLSREKA